MQKYVIKSRKPKASKRIRAALFKGLRRFASKNGQTLLQEAYKKQDNAAQRKAALDIRIEMLSKRLKERRDPKRKQATKTPPETLPTVQAQPPLNAVQATTQDESTNEAEAAQASVALAQDAAKGAFFLRSTQAAR